MNECIRVPYFLFVPKGCWVQTCLTNEGFCMRIFICYAGHTNRTVRVGLRVRSAELAGEVRCFS